MIRMILILIITIVILLLILTTILVIYVTRFGINMNGDITLSDANLSVFKLVHECQKMTNDGQNKIVLGLMCIVIILFNCIFSEQSKLFNVAFCF